MITNYLLTNKFKKVGMILIIPSLIHSFFTHFLHRILNKYKSFCCLAIKKIPKYSTRVLLIISILSLISIQACYHGIPCFKSSIRYEINDADLILQGKPIEKRQIDNQIQKIFKVQNIIKGISYDTTVTIDSKYQYKFLVEKVWKGNYQDTILITTGINEQDSGSVFEKDKSYVVYSANGKTHRCSRNALADSSIDILTLDYLFVDKYSKTSFVDNEKLLNENESYFLNKKFSKTLKEDYRFEPDFFDNKAVIFTDEEKVICKNSWFLRIYDFEDPAIWIIKLNNSEKIMTGYDLIIITWCKLCFLGDDKDEVKQIIFKQLKNN